MQRNLFQTIKRFLSPIKKSPIVYSRAILIFTNWWINAVIHIFFLQKITFSLENKDINLFNKLLFFYVLYFFYFYLFEFIFRKYGWTEVMNQVIKDIQSDYIKKYVKLDNNFTEKVWTWKSISIIDKWFDKWWELMITIILQWTSFIVSLVFTFYMLSQVGYFYVLIFLFILLFVYIISFYFNNLCLKYRRLRNEAKNLHTKQLVKILMSKNEIFQSNKVNKEIKILDKYMDDNIYYNKMMWTPIFWLFRFPDAFILIFLILIFYFLWNRVLNNELLLSSLVWITWSIIVIQKSMDQFLEFFKNLTKDFVVVENLWDYFDNTPEIEMYDKWEEFICEKWSFSIKSLTYWYTDSKKVFEDFSLEIEWKKIFAIVWNSWSWKTTLVKLLAWYIRQDSWDILVDSQNTKNISLKSYYQNIWYLTQDPSIFDGTILENLTYSVDREVNDEELNEIIKLAKCDFIYEFKDSINTEIWERWIRLSWWQRQRLAIAKVMLKNPKIIILDEPTSALDSFSEEQITKAMHNLFAWRTVIIIAHRLQTVKNADEIIVLEDWKVVESWTHKTLINENWIYKKMLDLQSGF